MAGFVIRATSSRDDEKIRWLSPEVQDSLRKLCNSRSEAEVFRTEETAKEVAGGCDAIARGLNWEWHFSVEPD
jgi:hypothetical protein